MLLLATSYDQIKSALSLSMISMANLQSVFLAEDQILSLKVQICKDNYQTCQISICLFSLKGVGAGIEIFWDILDSSQITQNIGYI